MGKGEIISHIADGEYNIRLKIDTSGIDDLIASLKAQIVEITAYIATLTKLEDKRKK